MTSAAQSGTTSLLSRLRRQPPVLSPLSIGPLARALRGTAAPGTEPLTELRQLLLDAYSADGAVLTGSGTLALQLALEAALVLAGGERTVALPAFCCFDVATAAVGVRGSTRITLYDVDPNSLAPDPASLAAAFRRGARVAVAAPLYGVPLPWDSLAALAADHDAVLIEDAAQGHGARWHGRPLGSLGQISVLSFGRGKGWTGGAGGALLWRGIELPEPEHGLQADLPLRPIRDGVGALLRATAQWALARPALYALPSALPWTGLGETRYREPARPFSMPPAVATLILATRSAALHEAEERTARGTALARRIEPFVQPIAIGDDGEPGYLRLPVRLRGSLATASALTALRHLGGAASYPTTLGELPAVRRLLTRGEADAWPGAARLVRELITLPTHSRVTAAELDQIVDVMRSLQPAT